ncbi:MAG: serine hydrolase domain-containing protein [Planctomycetota bacterium]
MRRVCVGIAALLLGCLGPEGRRAAGAEPTPDRVEAIRDYLDRCAGHGWSGCVCVVWDDKPVVEHVCGLADRAAGRAPTSETLFEVASVTKVFTACAILRLVEQGRLALDDPLAKHVEGVPADKSGITLRHLLNHTSGMPRAASGGGTSPDQAVASYLRTAPAAKPGERVAYWNGGYALLAAVIERATAKSFESSVRKLILEPAGMTRSGFTGEGSLAREEQAVGYDGDRAVRRAEGHPYGAYDYGYKGMGGLVTTANDLVRFARAWWNQGVVNDASRREMIAAPRDSQGLGFGVLRTPGGPLRLVHGGDVRGFHSAFEILPEQRAAIIVLGNVEGIPAWKLQWNIQALLFGAAAPYPIPPSVTTTRDGEIKALVGTWVDERGGNALAVAPARGGLRIALAPPPAGPATREDPRPALVQAATDIVRALEARDAEAIRSLLPDGVAWARTWPRILVDKIWPDQLATFGTLGSSEVLEIAPTGPMEHRAVVLLRQQKADRWMNLNLSAAGRIHRLSFDSPVDGVGALYRPAPDGTYQTFDWNADRPAPVLRLEREANGLRALVLGDGAASRRYSRP